MLKPIQARTYNRPRARWFVSTLVVGALASAALVGCNDDDSTGASSSAGDGGTSGQATGGSKSGAPGAGAHAGGAPAEGGGSGGGDGDAEALATEGDRRIPYTPTSDLAFAEFFIMHHQMAIDMAMAVTERGASAEIKAMAQAMIDVQMAEVETLTTIRDGLTGTVPAPPEDAHATAEMANMEAASGVELDRMFLLEMIPHHASALGPAHRALAYLRNATLKQMAADIVSAQAKEIGELRTRLRAEGVMGGGEDAAPADDERADFGLIGDRRIPLTPKDDIEFIDFFLPHHEMAVEMADHQIAHGSDPDVIAMATMMKLMQTDEIELMRSKREEIAGSPDPVPMPEDPHAVAEMAEMMTLKGAALDRMFLEEMIVHHSTALPTTHRAKPHLSDADLSDLADAMFDDQAREVGEMQEILEQ